MKEREKMQTRFRNIFTWETAQVDFNENWEVEAEFCETHGENAGHRRTRTFCSVTEAREFFTAENGWTAVG
jgi:hypothetical protein